MRSYARFLGLCCLILACDTNNDGKKADAGGNGGQHDAGGTGGDGDTTTPDAGGMDAGGGGGMDAGKDAGGGGGDGDMTVDAGTDSGGGGGDGDMTADAGHDGGTEADAGHDAGTVWPTNGLRADYYDGKSFVRLARTKVDEKIDFELGDSVKPIPEITISDRWSIRWTGEFEPLYNEAYTFYASMDDGMKVWIDGQLIMSKWNQRSEDVSDGKWTAVSSHLQSQPIALQANHRYSLRVEYFQGAGTSRAHLEWESTSQSRQVIPNSQLFPADMNAHFDISVCQGADPSSDYPDPTKPGCNSFETEAHSGATYKGITITAVADGDHTFVGCGPCSPVNWGPGGGAHIRFDVPNDGEERSSVTMNIPRATAGTYLLRFWFALERQNQDDPPVVATATINDGTPVDLSVRPTLPRDSSTVNEAYDVIADLKAGDNKLVVEGPAFGASPDNRDLLRFDRVTVENLDHTTSP